MGNWVRIRWVTILLTELGIGQIGKVIDVNSEAVNSLECFQVVRKDERQVGAKNGLSINFFSLGKVPPGKVFLIIKSKLKI